MIALATTHCGSSTSSSTPAATYKVTPPVVGTDRFPHDKHTGGNPEIAGYKGKGLFCGDCHDPEQVKAGRVSRPGLLQHAPCDDCHKAEFAKPPGIFCKVCHVSVDPRKAGNSPLESYPERGATQALAAVFSHKLHLDSGRMEDAAGFHLDCADCHVRDQQRDPSLPQHAACARCHEQSPAAKAKLAMENCTGCHPKGEVDLKRGRIFITADLKFAHATHEKDRAGTAVRCTVCHVDVAKSSDRTDVSVPAMERCATCHEDRQRSPDRVRMSRCGVCHSAVLTGEPPTNHMLATGQQPTDHTLEFRKSHADAAAAKDSTCRFCHTELSGAREDTCFQCHQVMKPHDHTMMWRDDHGKEAENHSDRCATCHTADSCVACHSVPPRSHNPYGEWRLGGHAEAARFGITACLTCHTYETTCSQCHREKR